MFSDDLALDVKGAYRDLIQGGASSEDAKEALLAQFKDDLADQDTGPVVWLAFAVTAWKLGRLDDATKARALAIIDDGEGLDLWDSQKLRRARVNALKKVAQLLGTAQPDEVKPKAPKVHFTDWQLGEVIGLKTTDGDWALLHVADHLSQGHDRYPVCELLNWRGATPALTLKTLNACKVLPCLPEVKGLPPRSSHRFVFQDFDSKAAKDRLVRTGLSRTSGFSVFSRIFRKKPFQPAAGTTYLGLVSLDGFLSHHAP